MTSSPSVDNDLVARCRAVFPLFELHLVETVPSTQDLVLDAARKGSGAGYCVVTSAQSQGRGRQGRRWLAPPGSSLLMSILVEGGAHPTGIPLAAGLAVCDAVVALGVETQLKWPNDVLINGEKVAGVLAEAQQREGATVIALGIGVNIGVDEFPADLVATSLHRHVPAPVARDDVLAGVVTALGRRLAELNSGGVDAIAPAWRLRAFGLGRTVTASTPAGVVRGTALDIDSDGALLVRTERGTERLLAGDVHVEK